MGYIFLASPYSHKSEAVQQHRYEQAMEACIYFAQRKEAIYCPVVHWHSVAQRGKLAGDAGFWGKQNTELLRGANKLYVLDLDGWAESSGVQAEMRLATKFYIPIAHVNPLTYAVR